MSIEIEVEKDSVEKNIITVRLKDRKYFGEKLKVSLVRNCLVQDERGHDRREVLFTRSFVINRQEYKLDFIGVCSDTVSADLHVKHEVEAIVEKSWALDIKESYPLNFHLQREKSSECPINTLEPKDVFNFKKNFFAVGGMQKVIIVAVLSIAAIIVIGNTVVGVHDQMVSEALTWFYSHRDSDGESQSPLMISLILSVSILAGAWQFLRRQLKKYMKFFMKTKPNLSPGLEIPAAKLIGGKSDVDLMRVKVRVVAGNIEHGSYERGSGSSRRTVWFHKSFKAVCLYEQSILYIPAGKDISTLLEGVVAFEPIFKCLYPTAMVDRTGLSLNWEIQLIHEDYVDQEVQINNVRVKENYFGASNSSAKVKKVG